MVTDATIAIELHCALSAKGKYEMRAAAARAHANIALIKYWGKRDSLLNLPATGSISVTLEALATETRVTFDPALDADAIEFAATGENTRIVRFLDLVRARAKCDTRAHVVSHNNFPTGAGLASSASGFAALAMAATHAAGLDLSPAELSALARRGSGSAARSIHGGWVEMQRGTAADGSDAHAAPLAAADTLSAHVVVAITATNCKKTGSTEGMTRTANSSPYFEAWTNDAESDLQAMRSAIRVGDFPSVGELTEHSCMKMHALMFTSKPPLVYWNPATIAAWQTVTELRAQGTPAYATIDAGPQVKVLCQPEHSTKVAAALEQVPGVVAVHISALGRGAHLIE